MGTRIEYVDTTQMYATNYIRNSKAVAVLWIIFTICYAIISAVAFATPDWIGDSSPENIGRLGLWQVCQRNFVADVCQRRWENILSVSSLTFQVATIFVGLGVIMAFSVIFLLALMLFLKSTTVFNMCGWAQIMSAAFMILGCATFPLGWNSEECRTICGADANRYALSSCEIKWAFALAVISCIDAIILATLAFILATKNIRLQPEPMYQSSAYKAGPTSNFT
ncbi:LHFPL tetraspan subfamily member 3 protein isoform X2 [Condylostylus longicornis]|uniref:LHFPL tetraspan subfamily member 3 protein isoform X2 n=1 Tax=Condylostylus longicornis TaxID=2530218 RepID=UPI00244DCAE2|nr:LHFPL tetraspan subfamily member 3 protein isoform X2 [Condylostylus longicornis]